LLIGIFDSGIGGITVLKKALEFLPNAKYLYYADTKNVPYGVKQKRDVINYVVRAFDFLSKKDVQIAVVACNTATSVAISSLRKKFMFPILGMEPAIKPAITNNSGKKILVLATSLTLRESKLEELISSLDKKQRIRKLALDNLVMYAEQFNFNSDDVVLYLVPRNINSFVFTKIMIYWRQLNQGGSHVAKISSNTDQRRTKRT
jgi:glutamate racemase